MRAPHATSLAVLLLPLLLGVARCESSPPPSAGHDPLAGIDDPQTLSQLLQWSLKHQDLDELHRKAEAVRSAGSVSGGGGDGERDDGSDALPSPDSDPAAAAAAAAARAKQQQALSSERRAEINALSEALMPNQVELMKAALAVAQNTSMPEEEREAGMLDLQDLLEDIDNAKDFKQIGGFFEVVQLLSNDEVPSLQAASAWALGSAVKNSHELQLALLHEGAMPTLLALLAGHEDPTVRAKAVYAISALLRNCPEAQAAFAAVDGVGVVLGVMDATRGGPRLVRKTLALLTDLMREQTHAATAVSTSSSSSSSSADAAAAAGPALFRNSSALCEAVLESFHMEDVDAQEKALQALEQMIAYGLLDGTPVEATDGSGGDGGAGTPSRECTLRAVIEALGVYRTRCSQYDDGNGGYAEGAGACDELMPVANVLQIALERKVGKAA